MKNNPLTLLLALSTSVAALSGCAWASRNVYQEPQDGNTGSLTVVLEAPDYRSNVWITSEPKVEGSLKAISVFDDTPSKTVKVRRSETIVLSLQLFKAGFTATEITSRQCGKAYQVPFSSGDLRVTLAAQAERCAFLIERRVGGQRWEVVKDAQEWTQPLVIK